MSGYDGRRWGWIAAACAVVALVATACSGHAGQSALRSATATGPAQTVSSSPTTPAPEPVRLQISPRKGARGIHPGQAITVVATGGTLGSVVVRSGRERVSGTFDPQRRTWRSTHRLHVSSRYTVTATGRNGDGATVSRTSWFQTLVPTTTFSADISEVEGGTYGVGMPVQVTFSQPVVDKAAVERALHITASKRVVGAWYWLDDQHVNFRPRDYWPARTSVTFTARLNGVRAAPGVFGAADFRRHFRIGDSLIVVASTTTHRLRLYRNGKLIDNWPISTGRPGHDTPNGTYLTIEKANPVRMRPADIAPGQPGYYDLEVPWSVRITWTGIYLHDAYWSVYDQGYSNVSHGCVNMPPAAAEAYYQMELPGDPVTITDSPVAGSMGNGWTDWFYSWKDLLDRSALHRAVKAGPHGSRFVVRSAVPPSTAKAPIGRAARRNADAS